MADEVRKLTREQRDIMRGERHTLLSWLITYGPVTALYVYAWVFIFTGPFGSIIPWLWPWLSNYLVVGLVLGLSLLPRLWVRGWLEVLAWRFKRGTSQRHRPENPNDMFEEMAMFGVTLAALIAVLTTLKLAVVYLVGWVLAIPFEVGFWTDSRRH